MKQGALARILGMKLITDDLCTVKLTQTEITHEHSAGCSGAISWVKKGVRPVKLLLQRDFVV